MSTNLRDETTETWLLTGQELVNFVLKSTESLHNVINRANASNQTINAKKRPLKRKINTISKTGCKVNLIKKNGQDDKKQESTQNMNNLIPTSRQHSLDYDFDLTSSSCEDLNEIPMEDLLSSPTWKHIVQQNSFVWP